LNGSSKPNSRKKRGKYSEQNKGDVMAWLPGWNSIETSTRLHDFFEVAGIVILGLLVLAEIIAYVYGHRRDDLIAITGRDAALKSEQEYRSAQEYHKVETAEMQAALNAAKKNAADAGEKAEKAIAQQAQRRLTDTQKRTLIAALEPFRGQKVKIASVMGDADAGRYKMDFLDVLRVAHWSFNEGTDVSQAVIMPTPEGIQVTVNQDDASAGRVLNSAMAFVQVLHKIGITNSDTIFVNPQVPSGQVELVIGTKGSRG
jgi:hypothetical protein